MSFDKVNQTHTPSIKDNYNMKARINMDIVWLLLFLHNN